MLKIITAIVILTLSACTHSPDVASENQSSSKLSQVLKSQANDVGARYQYRNPQETLEFFGIEPGMTVLEAHPGEGWYSKILLPYLGANGHIIGAQYPSSIWAMFGLFDDEEVARREQFVTTWPVEANA